MRVSILTLDVECFLGTPWLTLTLRTITPSPSILAIKIGIAYLGEAMLIVLGSQALGSVET